jgi:hypothetical protein
MTSAPLVFLLFACTLGALTSAFPVSSGCAKWGCDPANSFATALSPPLARRPRVRWAAAAAGVGGANSAGCVAGTPLQATCVLQSPSDAGFVTFDAVGTVLWRYQGPGAQCSGRADTPFAASNLPVLNQFGDLICWDGTSIAYVNGARGTLAWQADENHPAPCGALISSVALTNQSKLAFNVRSTGELFEYTANGVPIALIYLTGNDTGSAIFPAPPAPVPTGAGIFRAISQMAVTGARAITLARLHSTAGPAGAASPHVYLLGMDQRNMAVDRIHWAWQQLLPIADVPALATCTPSSSPTFGVSDGIDPITVAGPLTTIDSATGSATAVLFLSCASNQTRAPSSSLQSPGDIAVAFGVAVNGYDAGAPAVPSVRWRAVWKSGADYPLESCAPSWAALDPSPASSTVSPASVRIFLFFAAGSSMAVVSAATGQVEAAPSMIDALNALPGDLQCGSSSSNNDNSSAGINQALSFVATGPALASWDAASQRTILLVPGVLQHQQPGHIRRSTSSATALSSSTATVTTVGVAAFALEPRGTALTALWCAPLPTGAAAPVTAQMALIVDAATNATVVVVPTATGIFGLGV